MKLKFNNAPSVRPRVTGFTAVTASVVGNHDNSHWSQAFSIKNAHFVAEITGENALLTGSQFFRHLQEQSWETVHSADAFKKLLVNIAPAEATYVALLVDETNIYLNLCTSGSAWVRRGKQIAQLAHDNSILTGEIKEGDIFLIASSGLLDSVGKSKIIELLNLNSVQVLAEQLTIELHKTDPVPVASALTIAFQSQNFYRKSSPKFTINKYRLRILNLLQRVRFKPMMLVIILLLVLLGVSIVLGIRKKTDDREQTKWNQVISEVNHKYDEGMALIDLNPVRARELLGEAKQQLEATQISNNKLQKEKASQIQKVQEGIGFALRSYQIKLMPFFDIDLIKPGGEGTFISVYEDDLVLGDVKSKSLYLLSLANKSSKIVVGDIVLANAKALAVFKENIYVLAQEISQVVQNTLKTVISADTEWGAPHQLAVFNENIYLLDTGKNQIWKYTYFDGKFLGKQNYLLSDTLVDLSGATDMVVDGAVWVTLKNKIARFVGGQEEVWSVKGLDEEFGEELQIFTDESTKNLYILDAAKKRVVVVDKEGTYLAQYRWNTDTLVSDFAVSEPLKKILLLSRDTIYAIELK